jgi:hypothetical protein
MSRKILQINLRFNVSAEELAKEFEAAAVPIAEVPGLKWKIFGMDEERGEAAGIYLFEDDASLKAYIEGPITARMKTLEAFRDISMKDFDVVEDATAITRGPVK